MSLIDCVKTSMLACARKAVLEKKPKCSNAVAVHSRESCYQLFTAAVRQTIRLNTREIAATSRKLPLINHGMKLNFLVAQNERHAY